jgi:ACS family hexuronate transporter-like MFS transporter
MFGSLAAMVFSQTAGYILQATGSYWSLFLISACAYVVALAIMHALAPTVKPVEQVP